MARLQSDDERITSYFKDGAILGTADFIAPEQSIIGGEVDQRADLYSLGATFYFLLAGHPPFPTGTVSQKLLWHRTKEEKATNPVVGRARKLVMLASFAAPPRA